MEKAGDVAFEIDKNIGRYLRIKGTISANNYYEISNLHLTGSYLHAQIHLLTPQIATLHFELVTTQNITLRVTASTLYADDPPRFLGRSLRLPIPMNPTQWMVLEFDMNEIIQKYCTSSIAAAAPRLLAVKKCSFCSNMLLRELISNDRSMAPEHKVIE